MADLSDPFPAARDRRHRWMAAVWIVPIAAAAIVLWLAWRTLYGQGPEITISFRTADGLEAKQSVIQHRGVPVGRVESLQLTEDLSRVIVHARVTRSVADSLNENTRFYIVTPHVGIEGITGLSTLVSGSYIEMYIDKGMHPQRQFTGIEDPPIVRNDTLGSAFVMSTTDLGSLTRGSPISYRGVSVGEVAGYGLTPDGKQVNVTAFVRAPYDRLVHPETRFWNAGGVDVSVGAQGVRIRANSWQQLLSGGIAFETPDDALARAPSAPNAHFVLYDNIQVANRVARDDELVYLADFAGNLRGVDPGTPVELQGVEVGKVKEVELKYDGSRHTLLTLVTLTVDPDKVQILNLPRPTPAATQRATVDAWIEQLVRDGLRAQDSTANLLTGYKLIALDIVKNAAPGTLRRAGRYIGIPTAPTGDIGDTLEALRKVLNNIDRVTGGPELEHALKSLDDTLTGLNQMTREVRPDLQSLIASLKETSDSIRALTNGGGPAGQPGPDITRMTRELTDAARSVRALADYLERHPEALLRGRKESN